MTRDELDRLDDHDLLVLLHERIRAHDEQHRQGTITFRWTVIAILTALSILVLAASTIATNSTH